MTSKPTLTFLSLPRANLIRSDLSADMEAYILERVELPIVILGIGIQRCSDLESPLPEGTQRFIRILAERDAFVFTRGEETATYLKSRVSDMPALVDVPLCSICHEM